ncbi:hypothetical protein MTR67_040004 [Solanum verrucosum]|uniref:Uncharacterized protein n=1 Tax=Solanum verrucosum TaxID=315347 RepID=A0AAF0UK14_SOLVR|nr:hypothetical protein MTR67_040004 [Solanum verrucosum]
MPNDGHERLDARFSITIDRAQYFELKNFNDTTHLKIFRLIVFMRNYGHEIFNSSTQRFFSKGIRNSTLKGLELEDTPSLKVAQLTKFMRNYGHETTRLEGLQTTWNSCIQHFSFSYLLPQD